MSTPGRPADFVGAFMEDYFAECEEHLTAVRRRLLTLEAAIGHADAPPAIVEELFRSFHSLKGISAMVEIRDAERLSHEMESVLRAIRQREITLSTPTLDALVDGVQMLEQVVAARRGNAEPPPIGESLARLEEASKSTVGRHSQTVRLKTDTTTDSVTRVRLWKVTFTPTPTLVARGI